MNAVLESEDVEDFLEHHGVRGQKWGIRNKRQQANKDKTKRGSVKAKSILQANKNTKLKDKKSKSSIKRGWAHLNTVFGQVQSDRAREATSAKRAATILRNQQIKQQRSAQRAATLLRNQYEKQHQTDGLSQLFVDLATRNHA